MTKILTILGARPQFIKAAAVSRAIAQTAGMEEILLHTGQHFDSNMSQVFFEQMGLMQPKYNLNIHSLSHGAMTGQMLEGCEKIILQEKPELVMVYGDTNSTLAGALAGRKLGLKVAHVEAGLRSFNMAMPEEVNRILTDRVSDLLFCPTKVAVNNLLDEGYDNLPVDIILSGDVMYDAALMFSPKSQPPAGANIPGEFALASVHRAENTDDEKNLMDIAEAINEISRSLQVIMPLHPRTRKLLQARKGINFASGVLLLPPVGYLEMLYLLKHCSMVLTDSGGLQKEAYFFKKPCITLREKTEWTELVEAGYNMVTGSKTPNILAAFSKMSTHCMHFEKGLYGDGKAAFTIAQALH